MRAFLSFLLLGFLGAVSALSSTGTRLLVVQEDASEKALYSQFWADLEARGFTLTFSSPKSDTLSLFRHGALAFDHLILTPPKSKGYGPSLTPKALLDFTNAGGNILLTLSADAGTPSAITSLLLELDIHLSPDRNAVVVDHFSYDAVSAPEQHDTLLLSRPKPLREDVKSFFAGDGLLAVPRAVGQALGNASPLLMPILSAGPTSYSYNSKEGGEDVEDPFATGAQIGVVSAMQARNSARFTVLGSLEMLADRWFDAEVKSVGGKAVKTANREFARQVTEWTFKEVGVLRVNGVSHWEVDGDSAPGNTTRIGEVNPSIYRIKNDVTFTISLSEYAHHTWRPLKLAPTDTLQLEFTMLSPFQRLPLKAISHTSNATVFSTTFRLPDQHGIFAFKVNYKRPFLTSVEEKVQVTVRHFAHDEWPRSWVISAAWPWIGGLWVVVAGWLGFVALWLYCEPPKEAGGRLRSLSKGEVRR